MPASHHDITHLIALVEAAKAQADRLGSDAGATAGHLEQALAAARGVSAHGGTPDEGLRLDELTTDNDK